MATFKQVTRSRRAFLGEITAVSTVLLAACASPPTPSPASPTQAAAAPAATAPSVPVKPAPTSAVAKPATSPATQTQAGEININLLALYTNAGGWEAVAAKYQAKEPGVKITVDLKPTVSGYPEWLKAQFASGTPAPSLVSANYAQDLFLQGKFADFLLYLDKINPYTSKPWKESFEREAFDAPNVTTGGVYMMNTESYQGVWFYNIDAFKKAGLGDKPPKDYSELIRFGTELKKAGYIPLATEGDVVGFGRRITWLHWTYGDQFTRSTLEIYRAKPGDWNFRKGIDDVWKLDVKDPRNDHPDNVTVNNIRWLQALRDKKIGVNEPWYREEVTNMKQLLGPMTQDGWIGTADAYPLFVTQQAAMYIDVTSVLTRLSKDITKLGSDAKQFEVGGFNFPTMTTSKVEAPTRGREGSLGFYGMPKKDQKQNDLEMDFLMYFTSPEGYETYMQASLDANNSKGFLNGIPNVKNVKIPDEMVKKFESIPRIGPVWQNPTMNLAPGWGGTAQQAWIGLAQQYYGDKIELDAFVSQYEEAIAKAFPEQLKSGKLIDTDLDTPEKRPPQR